MFVMAFCPPRSPVHTPPDFFLCGFLKARIYFNNPRNMEDRKPNTGRGGGGGWAGKSI